MITNTNPVNRNLSEKTVRMKTAEYYLGDIQPHIPNTYSINTSKDVGQIFYQMTTNPHGALTINVPIEVYSDPKGLTPEIALAYNSSGTNGVLGMGWNLNGISNITRINKSFYYDNKVEAVSAGDINSAFVLDGLRLIKTEENSTQINYHSEQGHIKVIGYLSEGRIRYFEAYYPNGQKGIYGFPSSTSGENITYPITSMTDKVGNNISYEYDLIGGHKRLKLIKYGSLQQAGVEFIYTSNRADEIKSYIGGVEINYDYRLTSINTKLGTNILRSYSFNYTTKGYVSALERIECSSSNKSYNPLIFYYGNNNQVKEFRNDSVKTYVGWRYEEPSALRVSKGKFHYGTDNDGLITFPNKMHYYFYYEDGSIGSNSVMRIRNSYDDATDTIVINTNLKDPLPTDNKMFYLQRNEGFIDMFTADLDNKPGEEVIKINNTCNVNQNQEVLTFTVYTEGLDSNPFMEKYKRTYNFITSVKDHRDKYSLHPKYYFTGDFTGEGRNLILAIASHRPMDRDAECKYYLFDLENDNIITQNAPPFHYNVIFPKFGEAHTPADVAYDLSDKLFTFDFNGDGKLDICHINDNGTHIYTFEKNNSDYEIKLLASYSGLKRADLVGKEILLGEFNGDGKPDFLLSPSKNSGNTWKILYATAGNNPAFVEQSINLAVKTDKTRFMLHDMNTDGITDLIEISGEGDNSKLTTYFISNGIYKEQYSTPIAEKTTLIPTGVQDPNYYNNIISFKSYWVNKISFRHDDSKNALLSGLINSNGIVSKISYGQLNGGIHTQGNDAKFPYQNFLGGYTAVDALQAYNKGENVKNIYYSYYNAVIHKQGLGFCGFGEIKANNTITGDYKYEKFDPYNYSVIKEVNSRDKLERYSYSVNILPDKTRNVLLSQRTEQDKLKGTVHSFSYKYDDYGNPTQEVFNVGDGISSTAIYNKYLNINNDNTYIIGLLRERTEVKSRNNTSVTQTQKNNYNAQYLLSLTTSYFNNKKISEEAYVFDDDLNLAETKSRSYMSNNWQISTMEYDSYGRIKKETDPLELYTKYNYNDKGQLQSTENHRGHTTRYEYDVWGRTSKVTYPDGTISETIRNWNSSVTGSLYSITEKASGQPESIAYIDALDREIRKGVKRFNNQFLYTDMKYDERNRLDRISLPFKNSPANWNVYSYDSYDRLTTLNYASGKIDSYIYDKLKVTTITDSLISTKTYDASGLLVKVKDNGGSITYNYHPDGRMSSVVAPSKITTRFGYDDFGRQTTIDDPSAGIKTIEYDAAGNVNKETDARGVVSTMEYDIYNRLLRKNIGNELITTYTYNSDGLVESIQSDNGTSLTYSYDNLLRLVEEKETIIEGKHLQKNYVYNTDGRMSSTKYSNQTGDIATENYIYTNGYLSETKLNNSNSIWKLTSENDLGMANTIQTGVLTRTYGYDIYGLPTGRSVKKNNAFIQNFSYAFSSNTSNLKYRIDNTRNIREDFGYDKLNRLTDFGNVKLLYNSKGNIVKNSELGRYSYSDEKPYAVDGLSLYGDEIPTRTQDITYNAMLLPSSIIENGYSALFNYSANGERIKMKLTKDGADILSRYYIGGQYELDVDSTGIKEKLYLGGTAYSASSVLIRESGGSWTVNYICRDYLGSITHITDADGNLMQELSYDPWGRLRNPDTQELYAVGEETDLLLGRGYTGHEHLSMFGLINMNARLYDPVIGRFLSPDPFVQAPDITQNFNRYTYGLNNPLRYTDPSGEIIPLLIVAGAALVTGYVSYGIVTGNWGMKAVTSGLTSAAFATLGFYTMGGAFTVSSAWAFAGKDAANTVLSYVIKPIDINLKGIGLANTTITLSPVAMLTAGVDAKAGGSGFKFGAGVSASQKVGDWTLTAGAMSQGKGLGNIYGGFSYDDGKQGFSYYQTMYMSGGKQRTGTLGARSGDWSLRWENDVMGDKNDRFRSNATEFGYKDYLIGTNVFTDAPKDVDGFDPNDPNHVIRGDENSASKIFNNKFGSYVNGHQSSSPLYVGMKSGNNIRKVGLNSPAFGDFFQNGFHHLKLPFIVWGADAIKSPNFNLGNYKSVYYQSGTYTPWSMY